MNDDANNGDFASPSNFEQALKSEYNKQGIIEPQ
jgi:hypothetical protein